MKLIFQKMLNWKHYAIVLVTFIYDFLLFHKWVRLFYNLSWVIGIYCMFKCGHPFYGVIFTVLFLVWKIWFTFPYKKRKICNTVMGPPGSGKTTFCAFLAKWARAHNEPCYANIPLKGTYDFSYARDFGQYMIEDATLIIDEAALEDGMNNRDFKKNFSDAVGKKRLETAKKHRHYGLELWMFSQADDVDLKLRELTQNYYVLRKTRYSWLLKIRLYDTDIDLDPMTQDFRKVRIKKRTYYLFAPVVWLSFDTEEREQLPHKDFRYRDI